MRAVVLFIRIKKGDLIYQIAFVFSGYFNRFILSLLGGFFIGSYLLPNSENTVLRYLGEIVCSTSHPYVIKGKELTMKVLQPQKNLNVQSGILYIGNYHYDTLR